MKQDKKKKILIACRMQGLMLLFSLSAVLSKTIGLENSITLHAILLYICLLGVLGVYAILWQKVIKSVPLSFAYVNKGVTVIWGLIWGRIFFDERISPFNLAGCILIIVGIILFASSDNLEGRTSVC